MRKNIFSLLEKSGKKYSNKIFLKDINKKCDLTYKETLDFVYKLNNFFSKKKIKKKEKIIVVFDNSILLSLLFIGITSSNRVFVPVNPEIGRFEFLNILKKSDAKVLIADQIYKKKFFKLFKKKSMYINQHWKFINKIFNYKNKPFNKNFNGLCEILFTSGSTGDPKGVMLTHKSILTNLEGLKKRLKLKNFKNFMAITPLFHNNGQFIPTLLSIKTLGTSLPVNSKTSVMIFWDLINKFNINYSSVMATHINYLLKVTKKTKKNNLYGLFCGGAKLDADIQKKFEKKFSVKIACNYGLTETSSIVASQSLDEKNKYGSVGKALFNNEVRIIDKNKIKKGLGEIIIRGNNLFGGYIKDKNKTNQILKNNWLYTGDLGKYDDNGNLYIHERKDNMIVVSGENIFPNEIEKFVNEIKKINCSLVVPVKDEITQNKLVLIYESSFKIKNEQIFNFLRKKISFFKIPKIILNCKKLDLQEIPKASNGKILRSKVINYTNNFFKKKFNETSNKKNIL
jgi:long-chain acyl-CoA synthetase